MQRFVEILESLALILGGFLIAGAVLFLWRPHYAGALTWAVGAGLIFGFIEVEVIGKLTKPDSKHLRLDGMIFPFFAIGVAAAVIVFQ